MKYLKEFKTENDYVVYRDSKLYIKPNVSISDDKNGVFYNFTPPHQPITYEYVDLGLPSGTKRATCNVGALKPSDVGLYFQWGDTSGYTAEQVGKDKQFTWNDYKFSIDGSSSNFSKYTTDGSTLELKDDAANANMGGNWHIPAPGQFWELIDNTTSETTTLNDIFGYRLTSNKDSSKFIFFPMSGYADNGSLEDGNNTHVWSSMINGSDVQLAGCLSADSSGGLDSSYANPRCYGCPVRGVIG